jgi:1-deoxy-D-xylulose-5-phosphate synthase
MAREGGTDVMVRAGAADVLLVAAGAMVTTAVEASRELLDQGIGVTVVDPRWLFPVAPELVGLARDHALVATLEDSGRSGGFGAAVRNALADAGVATPVQVHAIPQEFPLHCKRDVLLARSGLTPTAVATAVHTFLRPAQATAPWDRTHST